MGWSSARAIGLVTALWALTLPALAGPIYTWEDARGVVHFVDSLELVPSTYRPAAAARAKSGTLLQEGGTYNQGAVSVPADPAAAGAVVVGGGDAETAAALTGATAGAEGSKPKAGETSSKGPNQPLVKDKAYWQDLISGWKVTREKAVRELETLDQEVLRLRTTTPTGYLQKLEDVQSKRSDLVRQIAEADRMLSDVIPAEARRSGALPGWLR